jgi:hypothetical protein
LNACPPKYNNSTPPTISAIEIAFVMQPSPELLIGQSVGEPQAIVHPAH